eukprot:2224775-Amphidinium_carterae.1
MVDLVQLHGLAKAAVIVEYGCGQGGLGVGIRDAMPEARCVLVEREARRRKLERAAVQQGQPILRLRVDIADFSLPALLKPSSGTQVREWKKAVGGGGSPAERLQMQWQAAEDLRAPPWPPKRVLACAKHLCGGATDIALRSLSVDCKTDTMLGVCMATCCHHRCDTATYINLPFLDHIGLVACDADMKKLAKLASWAVGGTGANLVGAMQRRRIGLMVKRILDIGRVQWLRDQVSLDDATLVHYIEKEVTPENVLIIAGGVQTISKGAVLRERSGRDSLVIAVVWS